VSTARVRDSGPRIVSVTVIDAEIVARFHDGRTVAVPLSWPWRLERATPRQREHYELIGDGEGVHWPDVDEDLGAQGFLTGGPAQRAV